MSPDGCSVAVLLPSNCLSSRGPGKRGNYKQWYLITYCSIEPWEFAVALVDVLTATMSESDHDSSQLSSDELYEDYHYDQIVTPIRSNRHLPYTTPRRRADRTASLSTAARRAVLSKSRTPERCFMTLENAPRCAIEVCHFIPKAARASEVGSRRLLIACPLILPLRSFWPWNIMLAYLLEPSMLIQYKTLIFVGRSLPLYSCFNGYNGLQYVLISIDLLIAATGS